MLEHRKNAHRPGARSGSLSARSSRSLHLSRALVGELIETRDEKYLRRFQKQLAAHEMLVIDELGYVPLSKTGAELLFETISQRYERASTLITSNLPFDE